MKEMILIGLEEEPVIEGNKIHITARQCLLYGKEFGELLHYTFTAYSDKQKKFFKNHLKIYSRVFISVDKDRKLLSNTIELPERPSRSYSRKYAEEHGFDEDPFEEDAVDEYY